MNQFTPDTNRLAITSQSLDALRMKARQSPEAALKEAAQQFEAVFMNMMLKSMRDATPQDGPFDSEQTKMFTAMLDQQLAQNMSAKGVGLADVMVKQLGRGLGAKAPDAKDAPVSGGAAIPKAGAEASYLKSGQQGFVQSMLPAALDASRRTGVAAPMILGQAALESGWGRREILMPDGSNSHNLFNIKAGQGWNGKVAEVTTTEYRDGVARKQVEKFRAYGSYEEAFGDYANLLSGNPRYAEALRQGSDARGFALAMQQAGYATDPHYADKLAQIIGQVQASV